MRRLIDWLVRRADPEVKTLDHVPVGGRDRDRDADAHVRHRDAVDKLDRAARRYGRAFKCAATGRAREVIIVPGDVRIVGPGRVPTQRMLGADLKVDVPVLADRRARRRGG